MPQLNPEFFVSQLFWLFVTFSFLLVFLWRISLPRISSVLNKREKKISENITEAKEMQAEAENIQKSIEDQLRQTRLESTDMLKKSSEELNKKAEIELNKIDKELEDKINQSAGLIEKNKKQSLLKIHESITDITKLIFSKVAHFEVSDNDIDKAIKSIERKTN